MLTYHTPIYFLQHTFPLHFIYMYLWSLQVQHTACPRKSQPDKCKVGTPIKFLFWRRLLKILLLTYKCLLGLPPEYLTDLIQEYKPVRNLRSSSKQTLVPSSVSTTSYGHRSFHHASPELWNKLPLHIKNSQTLNQFKSSLKTYLFELAFL